VKKENNILVFYENSFIFVDTPKGLGGSPEMPVPYFENH
jgi:hypothetical protein